MKGRRVVLLVLAFVTTVVLVGSVGRPLAGADPTGIDVTRLPVGDQKHSTSAKRGYVWPCRVPNEQGGAGSQGPWFNGDGTWDLTKKLEVDGNIDWPEQLSVTKQGETRVITSNGLPSHRTGKYPIESSDDVYAYDKNPSAIRAQSFRYEMPATPDAGEARCVSGEVGILLTGSLLFDAFDAGGRDAPAWEAQDSCGGHPQNMGVYHYHSLNECWDDKSTGHSALLGYGFDGFGIYGHHGTNGATLTNSDLDDCHGHTHSVTWDGTDRSMYHYHTTYEFPYTVGCFRGEASAGTNSFSRDLTFKLRERGDSTVARGSVDSESPLCEAGVVVDVERRKGGRWKDAGDDRTNDRGAYSTRIPGLAGKYRAHVSRDTVSGVVCGNAVSDALRL